MSRRLAVALVLFGVLSPLAVGQDSQAGDARARAASEIAQGVARMEASRQEIVAQNLTLDATEAEEFWPVYRAYRYEVGAIQERRTRLLLDYAQVYEAMDDAAAKPLLKEWFSIRKDELKIKDKFRSRMERVLPPAKVLRFFQIDHRLDLAAQMKLSQQVPLVE